MEWEPTPRDEMGSEAFPKGSSGALPIGVVPSKKLTIPVGVADPDDPTSPKMVMDWPKTDGFVSEPREIGVDARVTVNKAAFEVTLPDGLVNTAR